MFLPSPRMLETSSHLRTPKCLLHARHTNSSDSIPDLRTFLPFPRIYLLPQYGQCGFCWVRGPCPKETTVSSHNALLTFRWTFALLSGKKERLGFRFVPFMVKSGPPGRFRNHRQSKWSGSQPAFSIQNLPATHPCSIGPRANI